MTNYPSYVPDKRVNLVGEQLRNRALTDTFEPGSVMKPFTIGMALNSGRVTPNSVIQTAPGSMVLTGTTIHDSHPHGALTVEQVIQVSSNVGTTKIAMQMQPQEMWETFSQAGFGQSHPLHFLAWCLADCALTKLGVLSSKPPCRMATVCLPRYFRWPALTPCSHMRDKSFPSLC